MAKYVVLSLPFAILSILPSFFFLFLSHRARRAQAAIDYFWLFSASSLCSLLLLFLYWKADSSESFLYLHGSERFYWAPFKIWCLGLALLGVGCCFKPLTNTLKTRITGSAPDRSRRKSPSRQLSPYLLLLPSSIAVYGSLLAANLAVKRSYYQEVESRVDVDALLDTLNQALKSGTADLHLLTSLARNQNLSAPQLNRLGRVAASPVPYFVSLNPNTAVSTLKKLIRGDDPKARTVALNRIFKGEKKLTEQRNVKTERLKSLPYLAWTEGQAETHKMGVTRYQPTRSSKGYNLYTDERNLALLIDMEGRVVHTWKLGDYPWCEYAKLLDDGSMLGVCVGKALVRVDWDSKPQWSFEGPVNHDVDVLEDGKVIVPVVMGRANFFGQKLGFTGLGTLSSEGRLLEIWSPKDHFNAISQHHQAGPFETHKFNNDLYHLNSIQVIPDNPVGERDSRFQAGNYLICLRNVNLILILDQQTKDIVWSWGEDSLDLPHHPVMLDTGRILIFDNGTRRGFSRVVELDPSSGTIVWEYRAEPPNTFFSKWRGSNQRLPNGNTLICESQRGRAFEVTREGQIVWEYWNPIVDEKGSRKRIYRIIRIPEKPIETLLKAKL